MDRSARGAPRRRGGPRLAGAGRRHARGRGDRGGWRGPGRDRQRGHPHAGRGAGRPARRPAARERRARHALGRLRLAAPGLQSRVGQVLAVGSALPPREQRDRALPRRDQALRGRARDARARRRAGRRAARRAASRALGQDRRAEGAPVAAPAHKKSAERGRGTRRARGRRRRRARARPRRRGGARPPDHRRAGGRDAAAAAPARGRQCEDRDGPAARSLLGAAARARRRGGGGGADRRPRRGEGAARVGGEVDRRLLHDVPRQPLLEVHRALGGAARLDAELRHQPLDARRRPRRARVRDRRPLGARARRGPAPGRVHARLRRRPAGALHAHVHAARRVAGLDLRPRQGVRRLRRPGVRRRRRRVAARRGRARAPDGAPRRRLRLQRRARRGDQGAARRAAVEAREGRPAAGALRARRARSSGRARCSCCRSASASR